MEHNLQPITVGYNVTKKMDMLNPENTEIDVYVGISPNILQEKDINQICQRQADLYKKEDADKIRENHQRPKS